MILPALNWRKLPPRIVTGSSVNLILNNVYDMLTGSFYFDGTARVTGSNSAWTRVGRFITGSGTGSNTEAVYCYPPTQTVMSQSVIICGINTGGAATTAANVLYATSSAFKAGDFGIACVKNAGTFSSWTTGSNGFGAGSQSTGIACFYSGSLNGTITPKITIYESQEALAIFFGTPSSLPTLTYGGIAGAFLDPEQITTSTDAEADNRLYGITTTSCGNTGAADDGIGVTWFSSTAVFGLFYHANTTYSKFLIFQPQDKNTRKAGYIQPNSTATSYMPLNTLSGKFNKYPIPVVDLNVTSTANIFLGRLREISFYRPSTTTNQILRDSTNNIFGFTVGRSETATGDTILLLY